MKLRNVAYILAGSLVVLAACAGAQQVASPAPADVGSDTLVDTTVDVEEGSPVDTLLDIFDTEKEAEAADTGPTLPTIDVVGCTKSFKELAQPTWYAEKVYPGRTKTDLARGIVFVCGIPFGPGASPPGYESHCVQTGLHLQDGRVAYVCGTFDTAPSYTVTIIMPPAP